MPNLETFLATIPTPIARDKARSILTKQYRFSSIGIATLAEWIEHQVESHGVDACRLTFEGGTTKKRAGVRFESKPKWALLSPDSGMDIGKTAARFAQHLGIAPNLDIDAHEKTKLTEWDKENNPQARHKAMYGW